MAGLLSEIDYAKIQTAAQPGQNLAATVFVIPDGLSVVINPDSGALQRWTLGASRTPTATFSEGESCTIHITAGAFTINWASVGVTWLSGAAPVLAPSGITPVTLYRVGGVIYGGSPVDVSQFATNLNGLSDVVLAAPANNQVLLFNGTNWVNGAAPGGGSGTVSSVALSVPTGLSVSGSPITTTGTLALTFTAGYSIPTTAKQTEWDTAFSQTRQWDGSVTGLVAATGRTSLGLGTAALSATGDFAPAAQGVTNGNSHDHNGGDGAQIDYSGLSGLPTLGSLAALSALGSITSAGAIGSTANLPLITTTAGAISVGSFGTGANTFCQGNDSRLSDARTPTAHNQAWSTITSTPTTLSGYGISDGQPLDSDLTAIAALTTTSFGRSFLDRADAAGGRALLGLGTLATQFGTFSGTSSGTNTGDQTITLTGEVTGSGTGSFAATVGNAAVIGKVLTGYTSGAGTVAATDTILQAIQKLNGNAANLQPLDSDLTSIAALTTTTYGRSQLTLADAAADTAQLNNFTTALKGLVPAPGTATGRVLSDSGSWVVLGGGGDALIANPLSQFAATTSAQLAGVISDETGSGALVFGTAPTITLPNATGLPLSTGVTGILPTANGGTGVDNSTGGVANQFWARPNGATGAATYRAIVAADIPTLNQSTTGSAATLTTSRTIGGSSFNGSANVTSFPAPGAIGGTTPSTGVFTTLEARSATSLLLGVAGTAVGSVGFRNATSGTITLAPPTGALGTVTLTLPAITDTLVSLTATQTLTNKTLTSPTMTGPILDTPASGTLTNCTGLPLTGLAASTTLPIGVGSVELGHASDTTLSRASAGVVAVEGVALARVIGSGTAAMGITAIASAASATLVTVAATGVLTTDVIDWGFNTNPNTVTGYSAASTTGCLVITAYPTAGNVNFLVSNPTAASITPGALTLNWKVTR